MLPATDTAAHRQVASPDSRLRDRRAVELNIALSSFFDELRTIWKLGCAAQAICHAVLALNMGHDAEGYTLSMYTSTSCGQGPPAGLH